MNRFGEFFKEARLRTGLTLREFCLKHGLDAGNMSRLERGLVPPPRVRDRIEQYARFLGLEKGTDDWYQLFDLAAAESGRIPDDVLSDQSLVAKLPLLFRTLRGQKISDDQFEELIRQIRGR